MEPYKSPWDGKPTKAIAVCPKCNATVDQNTKVCQSCGKPIIPECNGPYQHRVLEKGERQEAYGPKNPLVYKNKAASFNQKEASKKNKKKKIKKVKDVFISEDFNM